MCVWTLNCLRKTIYGISIDDHPVLQARIERRQKMMQEKMLKRIVKNGIKIVNAKKERLRIMQIFMKKAPLKLLLYKNTGATIAASLIYDR